MIPAPIEELITHLCALPTVGTKTAERLTFYLLKQPEGMLHALGKSISTLKEKIHFCPTCFHITEDTLCDVCRDEKRDKKSICVVEEFLDLIAIEKTHSYQGTYHVLQGTIAPLQGIGPRQLRIQELQDRLGEGVEEVIIATNPTMEGEATAMYIKNMIKEKHPEIRVSRIAKGMPQGGDLEYADDVTISNALSQRTSY